MVGFNDIISSLGEDSRDINSILSDIKEEGGGVMGALAASFNDSKPNETELSQSIFEDKKHQAWKEKTDLARCDMHHIWKITPRGGVLFVSIWKKTLYGKLLTEIKADDKMIPVFADGISDAIRRVIGDALDIGGWAIITAPRRRHLERNFATLVCIRIAEILHIPFHEDILQCHSKHRVNAVFDIKEIPEENNLIVVDDIVTTGSTLGSIARAFEPHRKNLVFFCGINNKL